MQTITFRDSRERKQTIEILYDDTQLLVLNKPARLRVIPDRFTTSLPNLRDLVQKKYDHPEESPSVWVVHRIDADTSGLVIFARTPEMHRKLNHMFENGEIRKTYLAIVTGHPAQEKGWVNLPLAPHPDKPKLMQVDASGKPSETEYEVQEKFRHFSLLKIIPLTGRTHQIRVHLKSLNIPLAVDPLYGSLESLSLSHFKKGYRQKDVFDEPSALIDRLTLHAYQMEFRDPLSGEEQFFEAPLPKDFSALLKALRKWDR